MRIEARAKINWTLDILGRREDGYHLMDMLMQSVALSDLITLEEAEETRLSISNCPWLTCGEDNLMMKAARAMQKELGENRGAATRGVAPRGVAMRLEKRLPSGAGMGGGSADAAAVIAGLNQMWGLHLTQARMEEIGLALGADVPFCLRGGLCRTTGIGEEMRSLPCAKNYWLVVVQPCRGLSTKEVFTAYAAEDHASFAKPDTDAAQQALQTGNIALLSRSLGNVLQPVSERMRPPIAQAIQDLKALGAVTALMTGSGSAVFGVFLSAPQARAALHSLQAYPIRHMTHTCQESLVFLP